jgi:hypothetical protein
MFTQNLDSLINNLTYHREKRERDKGFVPQHRPDVFTLTKKKNETKYIKNNLLN